MGNTKVETHYVGCLKGYKPETMRFFMNVNGKKIDDLKKMSQLIIKKRYS